MGLEPTAYGLESASLPIEDTGAENSFLFSSRDDLFIPVTQKECEKRLHCEVDLLLSQVQRLELRVLIVSLFLHFLSGHKFWRRGMDSNHRPVVLDFKSQTTTLSLSYPCTCTTIIAVANFSQAWSRFSARSRPPLAGCRDRAHGTRPTCNPHVSASSPMPHTA